MDVEDLVAQERQRPERVERVGGDHADDLAVRRHCGHRAIERRQGIVGEQESQPGIEAGRPRLVDRLEAIEPEAGPRARAHADLEREDLGRQLAPLVELDQQGPEVGDRVGDRRRIVGVRSAARQRRLESAAGLTLPVRQPLPEQPVELPDRAVAEGRPVVDDDPVAAVARNHGRAVADRCDGAGQIVDHPLARRPAQVDGQLGQRQALAPSVRGVAHRDGLAEIRLVLDPVEVQPQVRQHVRVETPLVDQREERGQHVARSGLAGLRQVVEVDDHGVQIPRVRGLVTRA